MTAASVALRIARRDAWQHRGRSLLVMMMVALPVLAAVVGDILVRSGEPVPAQEAQMQLAGADAWIVAPSGVDSVTQLWRWSSAVPMLTQASVDKDGVQQTVDVTDYPARPADRVQPLLPPGSHLTPWRHIDAVPVRAARGGYVSVAADQLDITDPASGGRYTVLSGTAPAGPGQIAVTGHLAALLHVGVGDTVQAGAPQRNYRVTAVVSAAATGDVQVSPADFDAVVTPPGDLNVANLPSSDSGGPRYLVTSPEPITLPMIDRLNASGVAAYSRAVATNPADRAALDPASATPLLIAGAAIGIAMAILQVVFLAGPAFAIGARRMRRGLGQLVAIGARPRHLLSVVLGSGVVLGAAGSLLGLAAGIGIAAALRIALRSWFGYRSAALQIHLAEVAGIAALGVVAAVLAAVAPALMTSRTPALALLARQPAAVRGIRWWSVVGAALAAAGVALTVWMAARPVADDMTGSSFRDRGIGLAVGVLLVEAGLLLALPLIVHLASRPGRGLPLSGRLALRDADRHRGRTTPAVAAVTVCATAAVLLSVLLASAGGYARSIYLAGIPVGDVQVRFDVPGEAAGPVDPATLAAAATAARAEWPNARTAEYDVVDEGGNGTADDAASGIATSGAADSGRKLLIPDANRCAFAEPSGRATLDFTQEGVIASASFNATMPTPADIAAAATDWRCFGRSYSSLTAEQAHVDPYGRRGGVIAVTHIPVVVVGGPALRQQLTGVADPAADAALAAGGAVAMDRTYLAPNGRISTAVSRNGTVSGGAVPASNASGNDVDAAGSSLPTIVDVESVPAVLGTWSATPLGVILSPEAAERLGWASAPGGLVVSPGTPATAAQAASLALAVEAATGDYVRVAVEPGTNLHAADGTRQPLIALLIVVLLLAAGTVVVVTALGLADAKPDLATLAAVGAPPRIRRLLTGWTAGFVAFLGCLFGGAVGLVPAWGLLRLIQTIRRGFADPIVVPWSALAGALVAIPLIAAAIGTLLPRSRLPAVARTE